MSVEFSPVTPPSDSVEQYLRVEHPTLARSRAVVDRAAIWLADCVGGGGDSAVEEAQLIVVAGHHPVPEAASLLSPAQAGFDEAVELTAREVGVEYLWIDAEVEANPPHLRDSLSEQQYTTALQAGVDLANTKADEGVRMLLVGDYGRGLTSTAAAIVGSVCNVEPVRIVGRGSGVDDHAWRVKTAFIRDTMFRIKDDRASAARVLRRAGTQDLAMLTGLLAQSAVRRTPVLFDGVGATAAALLAHMLVPAASSWWWAATAGTEPATKVALDQLGMKPLLDSGVSFHQGAGALTALPLLRHAVRTLPTPARS